MEVKMKKTLNLSFLMLLCVLLLSCTTKTTKKSFIQTLQSQDIKINLTFWVHQDHTTQEVFQEIDNILGVQNRTIDEENEIYINKLIGESYLLDGKSCRVSVSMHVNRKSDRKFSLNFTNFRRTVVPKEESDKRVVDYEGNVLSPAKDC